MWTITSDSLIDEFSLLNKTCKVLCNKGVPFVKDGDEEKTLNDDDDDDDGNMTVIVIVIIVVVLLIFTLIGTVLWWKNREKA